MKGRAAIISLLVLLPFAASAETAAELQARIQALLQEVTALQQSLGGSSASSPTYAPVSAGQCPLISRSLKLGSSGDDVSRLQAYLARDPSIYPEALVTGYYGALTEAAIKKFQCKNQIVCDGTPASTGYGVTGPRTAAILALQCPAGIGAPGGSPVANPGGNVGGYMRVTPIQGVAPLAVSVEVHANTTRSCSGGTYQLFFGDGSTTGYITVPVGGCGEVVQSFNHTYATPGDYILTLRSGGHTTNATVKVVSAADTTDSISASPRSGSAPLNVSFTGKANASLSCAPATYRVDFGDGTNVSIPVTNCSVSNYAITHTYNSNGTYTAQLQRGGSSVKATTITVGSGGTSEGGGSFNVSLGYGGDAFSVLATFELSSSCTVYDIDWGDGKPHSSQADGSCSGGVTTKEVPHTYTGTGTYTVTLKRGSGSGQTTNTAGVSVVY